MSCECRTNQLPNTFGNRWGVVGENPPSVERIGCRFWYEKDYFVMKTLNQELLFVDDDTLGHQACFLGTKCHKSAAKMSYEKYMIGLGSNGT